MVDMAGVAAGEGGDTAEVFVYHASFNPPLATKFYEHLGERVLTGWLLLATKPLPRSAPFTVRRSGNAHTVSITPLSLGHAISQEQWALASAFHQQLFGWVCEEPRPGVQPSARAVLDEFGLLLLPALATLPAEHGVLMRREADETFLPPPSLKPSAANPVDWEGLALYMRREPALPAIDGALAATGCSYEELRYMSVESVKLGRAGRFASRPPTASEMQAAAAAGKPAEVNSAAISTASAASASDAAVDTIALRARKPLLGRVVVTTYNGREHLVIDLDTVRSPASAMPRDKASDAIVRFSDHLEVRYGLKVTRPTQPLLAVGKHLSLRPCRVDESEESCRDRFVTPSELAPPEQQCHATLLIPEACELTGLTTEVSPEHNAVLLPELAWNVAVWHRLEALETNLGLNFRDKALLREALTHPDSADARRFASITGAAEEEWAHHPAPGRSYQRLEWLGDAVLKAAASVHVFRSQGTLSADGHELERLRQLVVSNEHLVVVGERLGLGAVLVPPEAEASAAEHGSKALADVVEALLGAVYLEEGWESACAFFETWMLPAGEEPLPPGWRGELTPPPPLTTWSGGGWEGSVPASGAAKETIAKAVQKVEAVTGVRWSGDKAKLVHAMLHPTSVQTTAEAAASTDKVCRAAVIWDVDGEGPPSLPHQHVRMVWLGDALLTLAVSVVIYSKYGAEGEASLSERRARIVRTGLKAAALLRTGLEKAVLRDSRKISGRHGACPDPPEPGGLQPSDERSGFAHWHADVKV